MTAKRNKIPGKVKAFWCWGCRSFIVIDWKTGKYFCARLMEDIYPREHMDCKLRTILPFTEDEEEEPEQFELDV